MSALFDEVNALVKTVKTAIGDVEADKGQSGRTAETDLASTKLQAAREAVEQARNALYRDPRHRPDGGTVLE